MTIQINMKEITFITVVLLAVTGCQLPLSTTERAHRDEKAIQSKIDNSRTSRNPLPSKKLTHTTNQSWIGHQIPMRRKKIPETIPEQLERKVDMTYVEPVTVREIGKLIASETEIAVNVASNIQNSLISDVDWRGPASAALDHITGRLGFSWNYIDGRVEIFHTKPDSWTIYAPAVTARWQASVGLSGSVQGGIGGSTLQAQDKVVISMDTAEFWNQLESTVQGLLSDVGKFVLNRQSGELTVVDIPHALHVIGEWVASKNEELSTQVQVHVELYEVERSDNALAGYDIRGIMKEAFGKSAAEIEFGSDDRGSLFGFRITHSPSNATDNTDIGLILRDATSDTRISKLTSTVIRGINGIPVPVFFGDETSYLERRDVVTDEGLTTVRLIPGKLQDGIALNMVPRILPNTDRLMLNITVRTTRIKGISRFPVDAGPKDPVIQLPDLESRSILLPVLLQSGETLFVAGLDTSRVTDSGSKGIFNKESKIDSRRASLVLMITPYIIRLPSELFGNTISRVG